jgi:endogenous inhibitor of DNA gyrase (YacG/DUF329 family)
MSAPRKAVLVATTVEVLCPYCAEPLIAPSNGSETMWALGVGDFGADDTGRTAPCPSCEKPVHIDPTVRPRSLVSG